MESKKSKEADIEQIRSSLFMGGLIFVSGIVLAAFTFQTVNGDKELDNVNEKTANNVYTQEVKKEEIPPPIETPQMDVPPPVSEDIVEEENNEIEPVTVVEVKPPDVKIAKELIIGAVVVVEEEVIAVVEEEEVIEFPDVEAEFIGGPQALMKYIQSNIQYPPTSIEMNEQGKVYLSFVVEPDGSITNVAVERGVSPDLDREAKRVIRSMPKWKPGEAKAKKSRTRCRLPINFQLG
jgi:protein TonB